MSVQREPFGSTRDGRPVEKITLRQDGLTAEIITYGAALRALRVPAGEHEIIMTFNPRSLEVTNTIGVISMIIIYLLCAVALFVFIRSLKKKSSLPTDESIKG